MKTTVASASSVTNSRSRIGIVVLVALVPATSLPAAAVRPVKVFILAGQSNMEGKAKISLLESQLNQAETKPLFEHLRRDGQWVVRDDVWIKFLDRRGNLTVGYGSPGCLGPELEFGNVVGDHFDEQLLIIKTAWGGKSLFRDFRPPRSGYPPKEVMQRLLEQARKRRPETTSDEIQDSFGKYYRLMLAEVTDALDNLAEYFPHYAGQGYELSGLVWFQGWNDMIDVESTAEYTKNLANLIRDVRADLQAPRLPVVIGQLGVGGIAEDGNVKKKNFKQAQAAVAELPEFQGNVRVVQTDQFWDLQADAVFKKGWREHLEEWNQVGSDFPYHYYGSVRTFSRIGAAFGEAMLGLIAPKSTSF